MDPFPYSWPSAGFKIVWVLGFGILVPGICGIWVEGLRVGGLGALGFECRNWARRVGPAAPRD